MHLRTDTMRILIVDDYPGLIELYYFALGARGFEVVGAATAGEAMTLAANELFDAVVLDVQLPDGSGPELLRRLRQMPSLTGKPFVGMSSFPQAEIPEAAQFDVFLAKPFHPKRLATAIRRVLDGQRKLAAGA